MEDIMSKLQGILNTKEGQEQLKNLQSMFGGQDNSTQQSQETAPPQNNGFDLSSLASMFSSMNSQNSQPQQPNNTANESNTQQEQSNKSGGFDMSALASMLGGLGGGAANSAQGSSDSAMPNIDINMIMNLQKVFSSMNVNDKNSQLLQALKPHFSEKRCKKVDQAISMMRLFSMLPMLKESGILTGIL